MSNLKSSKFEKIILKDSFDAGELQFGNFTFAVLKDHNDKMHVKSSKNTFFTLDTSTGQIIYESPVIFKEKITAMDDLTFKGEKGDKGDKGDKGAIGPIGPIGPPGADGDISGIMPDWVIEWDGDSVKIGSSYLISPKIFTGSKDANNKITGVLLGNDPLAGSVGYNDLIGKSGIIGVKDNEITFFLDSSTGDAIFKGHIEGKSGNIGPFSILTSTSDQINELGNHYLEFSSSGDENNKMRISKKGLELGLSNDGPAIFLNNNGNADFKGTVNFKGGSTNIDGEPISSSQIKGINNLIKLISIITNNGDKYNLADIPDNILDQMIENPDAWNGVNIQFPFELSESSIIK